MQSINSSIKSLAHFSVLFFVSWACSSSIIANTEFSKNVFDSSISAIGGSSIGKKELPSSIFYNWAAPSSETTSIMFQSGSILEAPYIVGAAEINLVLPFRIAYLSQTESEIPESIINDQGIPETTGETMAQSFQSLLLSFSHNVMGVDIGWLLDYSVEALHKETGHAMSMGLALRKEFHLFDKDMGIGISTRDLISGGQVWTTGLTESIPPLTAVALDLFLSNDLHVVTGVKVSNDFPIIYSFGTEYTVYQSSEASIIGRAGIETENLRFGLGLNFNGYELNYAYHMQTYSFLENEHQVSFHLNLNKIQKANSKNSSKEPNAFRKFDSSIAQKYKAKINKGDYPLSSSLFKNSISSLNNQKMKISSKHLSRPTYKLKQAPITDKEPSVPKPTLVFSALLSNTNNGHKIKIEEFNSIETKNINNENDQLIKKRSYELPFSLDFTFKKKRY